MSASDAHADLDGRRALGPRGPVLPIGAPAHDLFRRAASTASTSPSDLGTAQPPRRDDRLARDRIAAKIPGIDKIDTTRTEDGRLLLRFNDKGFKDPFFAQQMSDGTLKLFAYFLLLEDPAPPPFVCIEEPENGLYHRFLDALAEEFRKHATGRRGAAQVFVTTHQPEHTPTELGITNRPPILPGGLNLGTGSSPLVMAADMFGSYRVQAALRALSQNSGADPLSAPNRPAPFPVCLVMIRSLCAGQAGGCACRTVL